jgi:hypothetical protein
MADAEDVRPIKQAHQPVRQRIAVGKATTLKPSPKSQTSPTLPVRLSLYPTPLPPTPTPPQQAHLLRLLLASAPWLITAEVI